MSSGTGIEWTNATWQVTSGCTKISPGCKNCYAMRMAQRLAAMADADHAAGVSAGRKGVYQDVVLYHEGRPLAAWNNYVELIDEALTQPLRWKKPRRIFINSMSDLFHEDVPFEFIDKVFAVMALTPQHTYQILTKRPERMAEYLECSRDIMGFKTDERVNAEACQLFHLTGRNLIPEVRIGDRRSPVQQWPLHNVWLGTSAEDQGTADERIPHLLRCPAAVRFVSAEPLLGPVDFRRVPGLNNAGSAGQDVIRNFWVIAGGESGAGARPCHVGWIRSIVHQCKVAGVPVFVKQLGSSVRVRNGDPGWPVGLNWDSPLEADWDSPKLRNRKGGDMSEWPEDLRVREFPNMQECHR